MSTRHFVAFSGAVITTSVEGNIIRTKIKLESYQKERKVKEPQFKSSKIANALRKGGKGGSKGGGRWAERRKIELTELRKDISSQEDIRSRSIPSTISMRQVGRHRKLKEKELQKDTKIAFAKAAEIRVAICRKHPARN